MKKPLYTILTLFIGIAVGMTTTAVAAPVKEYVQASFEKITFIVNGEEKTLDSDPLVYQGSTYLQVRTVLNALGYDVGYKADSRTVTADKSFDTLSEELNILAQKEEEQLPVINSKSKEEQIEDMTNYLNAQKEKLDNYERMVKTISERTDLSEEDKEWGINLRKPAIESTKKIIAETEAKLAELQSQN
ncbi:stalk domain-containing protein [Paenibacillus sp. M1]|uniref:Stalk domain-containing protein n=1 Tax=Paenibacillus haidiansis TaxID=1574488 RepID=A0ABU7VT78_9BACL